MTPRHPVLLSFLLLLAVSTASAAEPFIIRVIDADTGRGVPLVRLRTVANVDYYTDSNGLVAFDDPVLLGTRVFFHVFSHGYDFPKDGFGMQGRAFDTTPGGEAELKIKRVNIAERLYRTTGEGIYRDTILAGRPAPIKHPLLNARVSGCDSIQSVVYRDRILWLWGDTNRPAYPLGCFKMSGASSLLPGQGGLDPDVGVDLNYWVDKNGFARGMAPLDFHGPTWLSGMVVLKVNGEERLFAHYINVDQSMAEKERGLVAFDDATATFQIVQEFPLDGPFAHGAHPIVHEDGGRSYVYYCDPFPVIRVEADPKKLADPRAYEAFTPLVAGTRREDRKLDRADDGSLRWAWKADTEAVRPTDERGLVRQGLIKPEEQRLQLADVESGDAVTLQRGSLAWNDYRAKWIMIGGQSGGDTSYLGEIWYAEADNLLGPWSPARKIVTHDKYTFYNPRHHPFLDADGGRTIYFEGTYTKTFSKAAAATPRYDYNQIMYKLDLGDERLHLLDE